MDTLPSYQERNTTKLTKIKVDRYKFNYIMKNLAPFDAVVQEVIDKCGIERKINRGPECILIIKDNKLAMELEKILTGNLYTLKFDIDVKVNDKLRKILVKVVNDSVKRFNRIMMQLDDTRGIAIVGSNSYLVDFCLNSLLVDFKCDLVKLGGWFIQEVCKLTKQEFEKFFKRDKLPTLFVKDQCLVLATTIRNKQTKDNDGANQKQLVEVMLLDKNEQKVYDACLNLIVDVDRMRLSNQKVADAEDNPVGSGSVKTAGVLSNDNSDNNMSSESPTVEADVDVVECAAKEEEEKEKCSICLGELDQSETEVESLRCKHSFHAPCIDQWLLYKSTCPMCQQAVKPLQGNQPLGGTMKWHVEQSSLPGYGECGTIVIKYLIPSGVQDQSHPNPGVHFDGTYRYAYLPDNWQGRDVLALLKKAFDARLIFTVGTSLTTGLHNQTVWNDIHHKTTTVPYSTYGYPDETYLARVTADLKAKGIC